MSNGILLAQKEDAFWQACHDNDIQIAVTQYPIDINVEKIRALAEKFGVVFSWFSGDEKVDSFIVRPIDLEGKGNIKRNFALCTPGNSCITLSHGRLFTCVFAAHVHHFIKKFGVDIPVTEDDYIDIYKAPDKDFILQKLSEPIPLCRYCNVDGIRGGVKWHISKKEMQEWL